MYRIRPRRGCTAAVLALAIAAGFTVDPVTGIPLALMLASAVAVDCVAAIHRIRSAWQVWHAFADEPDDDPPPATLRRVSDPAPNRIVRREAPKLDLDRVAR